MANLTSSKHLLWKTSLSSLFFCFCEFSALVFLIRSLRYASISFEILYYISFKGVLGFFCLFEGWQHSNSAPAQAPFWELFIWNYLLCICYSQIAQVTTDPDPNTKGQRALIHELLGFLTSGPEGILHFFFFYFRDFHHILGRFILFPFLQASTRGQASEASWFPGMWVNRILW